MHPILSKVMIVLIIVYVVSIGIEVKLMLSATSSTGFKVLLVISMVICCGWIFATYQLYSGLKNCDTEKLEKYCKVYIGLFVVCTLVDCLMNLVGWKYSWTAFVIVAAVCVVLYGLLYKYMKEHAANIKVLKDNHLSPMKLISTMTR